MRQARNHNKKEQGIALFIAMMILLTLTSLGAALMLLTQTEIWTSGNYRLLAQARYAAEAGAQQTANWLNQSYTSPTSYTSFDTTQFPVEDTTSHSPIVLSADSAVTSNYPFSAVQTAFNTALNNQSVPGMTGATYSTSAKLLTMTSGSPPAQLWEITSKGSIAGVRTTQVQVVERIERLPNNSIPMYAAFATGTACNSISTSGTLTTDSFDSSAGTYAATHVNSGSDLGTNGSMLASGSPAFTIHGGFKSPLPASKGSCPSNSYNYSGTGTMDDGATRLSGNVSYPNPPPPTGTPTSSSQNVASCSAFPSGCSGSAGNIVLAPGTYNALLGSGTANVHLNAGTYNFYSFTFSGTISIVVDSGPVTINLTSPGSPIAASGSWVNNPGGKPTDLRINYSGTGSIPLSGASGNYALIYAPNATVAVSGGTQFYGSVIAKTFTTSGTTSFHFDSALASMFSTPSNYHVTWFSWSKY